MFDRDSDAVVFGTADAEDEIDYRSEGREYLAPRLSVYEEARPETRGQVQNISEHGIGLTGIHARVHEIKTFVIAGDETAAEEPCQVQAVCRWVKPKTGDEDQDAGFEIVGITQENWRRLQELVPTLNVEEHLRTEERHTIDPPIPVYEVGKTEYAGYIVDVSSQGFRIIGLEAKVGERKKLVLKVGDEISKQGIEIEALCRWLKPRDPDIGFDVGFEIMGPPGESFKKFVELHPKSPMKY
ncbi:MAG: hypothetical protein QG577_2177 [Thermodesulfobacteriota bacterium]|nr:hypothetical protein [Thermodesulfobacteriota bacterium]